MNHQPKDLETSNLYEQWEVSFDEDNSFHLPRQTYQISKSWWKWYFLSDDKKKVMEIVRLAVVINEDIPHHMPYLNGASHLLRIQHLASAEVHTSFLCNSRRLFT